MKKFLLFAFLVSFMLGTFSCRETTERETEEALEEIGEDVERNTERAAEEIEEGAENLEREIEEERRGTDDVQ